MKTWKFLTQGVGLLTALIGSHGTALSGGPLGVAVDGTAVGWSTSNPIRYQTDQGSLGLLSNTQAAGLVEALFATWQNVPTATIAFERAGATQVDINATNFGRFLGPFGGFGSPLGQSVIVFDADGSIFDMLFGIGTQVLGFADPTFFSNGITTVPIGAPIPSGSNIIEGLAFLNGKFIDSINDPGRGNFELPLATFESVFVHEFGHFAGIDHTQIHGLRGPPESDSPFPTQPVETMFPFIFDSGQKTLERDDVVALSTLYPTADFFSSTGSVTGRVLTNDGVPISGINVIARNIADDSDAISFVSGGNITDLGTFSLYGLMPGASYRIDVQQIDPFHTGGSSVGPFSPPVLMPGPPEFYSGTAESADPAIDDPSAFEPIITGAGSTVTGIEIVLNRQLFSIRNVVLNDKAGFFGPRDFAIADFNRDGILDFVAPHIAPGAVLFFRGLGAGIFADPVMVGSFPNNDRILAGQFNRGIDDFVDIAVASSREVRVFFGNGAGGFGPPKTLLEAPAGGGGPGGGFAISDLAMGDLNDDGVPDLVALIFDVANRSATFHSLLGSASGEFSAITTELAPNSGIPLIGLAVAQFAGSPAADVIGIASSAPPVLGLLIGNGQGGFSPVPISVPGAANINASDRALAVGDFDENGTMDLALNSEPLGGPPRFTRSAIDILLGDGSGGFTLSDRYFVPESIQDGIIIADLDNDGHLDIASTGAFFGPGSPGAKVTIGFGNGSGRVREAQTIWGLAGFPTALASGDLDGDHKVDLLVSTGRIAAAGLLLGPSYAVLLNQIAGALSIVNAELSGEIKPGTALFDPTPAPDGPAGTFSFTSEFCNIGMRQLTQLKSVTRTLTNSNVLLNRDAGTPAGVGSELTFPASGGLADRRLFPSECTDVFYKIGLATVARSSFSLTSWESFRARNRWPRLRKAIEDEKACF